MTNIRDPQTNDGLKVSAEGRGQVHSVNDSAARWATERGDAYNLNTGRVTLSADTAIMYLKNNEDWDFQVEALIVGISPGITYNATDNPHMILIRNPTAGTCVALSAACPALPLARQPPNVGTPLPPPIGTAA